MVDSVQDSS